MNIIHYSNLSSKEASKYILILRVISVEQLDYCSCLAFSDFLIANVHASESCTVLVTSTLQ